MSALFFLVAIRPLVVAWRIDEGVLEANPQISNRAIVDLCTELTAGVNIAHLEHQIDFRILINGVNKSRRLVDLNRVGG
jgi:hypothetical protein